jgi:hypothetical protein
MKIKKFCKVTLALAVAVSSMASVVCEASNLDTYRNLLMRKTYTIKYQEITPQARATNKDRINLYGKNSMDTGTSDLFVNKPTQSILVCDGDNKYEEIGVGNAYLESAGVKSVATCRLQKGDEVFNYTRYYDKDKLVYRGTKKGSVSAVEFNILANLDTLQFTFFQIVKHVEILFIHWLAIHIIISSGILVIIELFLAESFLTAFDKTRCFKTGKRIKHIIRSKSY